MGDVCVWGGGGVGGGDVKVCFRLFCCLFVCLFNLCFIHKYDLVISDIMSLQVNSSY